MNIIKKSTFLFRVMRFVMKIDGEENLRVLLMAFLVGVEDQYPERADDWLKALKGAASQGNMYK